MRSLPNVGGMEISSMIMGASIASIAWIGFYPWSKLKRLRELEEALQGGPTPGTPASES